MNKAHETELEQFLQELWSLEACMGLFCSLFATDPRRTAQLGSNMPLSTSVLFGTLLDGVILRIARLFDPPEQGGENQRFVNFVVERLVLSTVDGAQKRATEEKLATIKTRLANIREHRNKRIAHQDYYARKGVYESHPLILEELKQIVQDVFDLVGLSNNSEVGFGFIQQDCEIEVRWLMKRLTHFNEDDHQDLVES